jgi:capsular polysaccharide biosynthesis protein
VERAAPPWFYRGSTLRALADYLTDRSRTQSQTNSSPDRLYVTRSDAAWRRVANEDAVRDLLHAEGFTTIACGKLSVVEQIKLFSRATHVVGAHGAGLANMMFCQPGSAVIEFATPDPHHHWRCYRNLAHALDLRYGLVSAESTAPADAGFEERRDADFVVDLDNLHEAVTRLN